MLKLCITFTALKLLVYFSRFLVHLDGVNGEMNKM